MEQRENVLRENYEKKEGQENKRRILEDVQNMIKTYRNTKQSH